MPNELHAISPIDGRYHNKTIELAPYFSEYGLIKYRVLVELHYLLFLKEIGLPQLADMPSEPIRSFIEEAENLSDEAANKIKTIERTTNHDVKAVEYFIKEKLIELGLEEYIEFVHFGLTSQDINNTAVPWSLKDALAQVVYPTLIEMVELLNSMAKTYRDIPLLARTHGQPATPTSLGKEIGVFAARIERQLPFLYAIPFSAKFGGATGNFNAHTLAYPTMDWHALGKQFVEEKLGLSRAYPTTQIEHYDMMAAHAQGLMRINTICIDLCRDMWTYISMEYFNQKVIAGEVGSSAMPHKVNPIDFENAEGNFGIANAIYAHLANKLPISRLQRDLTDSTVLRNIGMPLAHTLIGLKSMKKGLSKVSVNEDKIARDLDDNWAVLSEAIQTVLRREGVEKPYEQLKALSRGNNHIDQASLAAFIQQLPVGDDIKNELLALTPATYIGQL